MQIGIHSCCTEYKPSLKERERKNTIYDIQVNSICTFCGIQFLKLTFLFVFFFIFLRLGKSNKLFFSRLQWKIYKINFKLIFYFHSRQTVYIASHLMRKDYKMRSNFFLLFSFVLFLIRCKLILGRDTNLVCMKCKKV